MFGLVIFFFNRQTHNKNVLEKGALRLTQAYRMYTRGASRHKKKKRYNTSPQLVPSQSKKLIKGIGPSFTTDLVHSQRLQTKEFFNL